MPDLLVDERTGTPYETYGEPSENKQVETQESEQPASEEPSAEKPISEKEKERRQEQSARDKLEVVQTQLEELKTIEPLYRLLNEDEEARKVWDNYLNGRSSAPAERPPQDKPLPERPQPPERPLNYSYEDARLDPSSESAMYDRKHAQYLEQRTEWLENMLLSEKQERQATIEQQRAAQEREAYLDKVATRAVKQFSVPEERLREFRQFIGNPTAELEEKVWAYYFTNSGRPSAEELTNTKREQDLKRRAEAAEQGLPAGSASTTESAEPSDGPLTRPPKRRKGSLI